MAECYECRDELPVSVKRRYFFSFSVLLNDVVNCQDRIASMTDEGIIQTGKNGSISQKAVLVPLSPPKISHELVWE